MTIRRRHIIAVTLQLIIVGIIVFFPESEKERRFTPLLPDPRPVIVMETVPAGDAVLDAMNEADLFERYRFTRAMGSESPETALLILPDAKFAESWHMETFLGEAYKMGLGALILDMKDAGEFIPLRSEDGTLRTTPQRYVLFADAAGRWLNSLGFKNIVLISMGNGAAAAWEIANQNPADFSGWVDIAGRFGNISDLKPDLHSVHFLPQFLFFSGSLDPRLPEKQILAGTLISNGVTGNLHILPDVGRGLLDEDGILDSRLENSVRDELLRWSAGQPNQPEG